MVDGRKAPVSMYYVGRRKDGQVQMSTKPHNAALMTEALAELLVTKLHNTGYHAEVCELLCDENSTILDCLVDISNAWRVESWYGGLRTVLTLLIQFMCVDCPYEVKHARVSVEFFSGGGDILRGLRSYSPES